LIWSYTASMANGKELTRVLDFATCHSRRGGNVVAICSVT
jgi:hypothetical protein